MNKYNIQAASKLTGIGIHTLRAWENRYGAIKPERTEKGRRLYNEDDIEKLQYLCELCIHGRSISTIANLNTEELKTEVEKLGKNLNKHTSSSVQHEDENTDPQQLLNKLLLALHHYKLDVISHEIGKISNSMKPRELALQVLSPLLKEVGSRVYSGTMNLAQEHALSSILKFHIGYTIYSSYTIKPKKNSILALTTPEGEYHEFGILISAILCVHYGIKFYFFGPNMPKESIIHAIQSMNADTLILGTTENTAKNTTDDLDHYIEYVLKKLSPKQQLWVGGSGSFNLPNFQRDSRFHYISTLDFLDRYLDDLP